jgi:predicted transcriptional regulator
MSRGAIELAAEVVRSFVSHNSVPRSDLSELFQAVHDRLKQIEAGTLVEPPPEPKTPAVPIRKSVTPDYLICLDDGLKFKSLRRHLATLHMTPEEYREKWSLPRDYPMVARNYAALRSALAKKLGLGQKGQNAGASRRKGSRGES